MEDRRPSRCWTDKAKFQSDGRTPQPERTCGSNLLVSTFSPKCTFDRTPHTSPPLGRWSCASGLPRSQSGTKLPFASVHARVTPAVPNVDVVCGIRSVGLVFA